MKKAALALTTALLATTASTSPALAYSRDFTIYNETPYDITRILFSTEGLPSWIPSSGSYVSAGNSSKISFSHSGPCQMQLRAEFANGNTSEWNNGFNFCQVSEISITYDRFNNVFRASYR